MTKSAICAITPLINSVAEKHGINPDSLLTLISNTKVDSLADYIKMVQAIGGPGTTRNGYALGDASWGYED